MNADLYCRTGYTALIQEALVAEGWQPNLRRTWSGNHDALPAPAEAGFGDLVVSCHWPLMFSAEYLAQHPFGGLNLHPNLSLGYKVEDPVGRALGDGHGLMSVDCHRMTAEADSGEILATHWRTVPEGSTRSYAYDLLRPLYASVLREAVNKL